MKKILDFLNRPLGAVVLFSVVLMTCLAATGPIIQRLRDLRDVRLPASPTDGQVLMYKTNIAAWTNQPISASSGATNTFNTNQFTLVSGTNVNIKTGALFTNAVSTNGFTVKGGFTNDAITSAIPYADASGGFGELTIGANLLLSGSTLNLATNPTIASATITNLTNHVWRTPIVTLTYDGTNVPIDLSLGTWFKLLVTNATGTFLYVTNIPGGNIGQTTIVELRQDGTGGRTITCLTNTMGFAGSTSPTFTTNANARDFLDIRVCAEGTNTAAQVNANFP